MDPITATTTIITLATFIKDLIDVGQSIKQSIEKVGENRRRIRDLTDDILRTLDELANLARGHEDQFQAPALLSALGNLKADMLHVLSICLEISPPHPSGLRGFRSHIKVWIKRDDIEARIKHLKAHAFSAARIEQTTARIEGASLHAANTTLRVEQKLIVNNVENQIHLRRLEGMMTRVLLETQFGQTIMDQTIEIIESDTTHRSLEFQYLSTEVSRLIVSLQQLAVKSVLILDEPLWASTNMVVMKTPSPKHILFDILWMSLQINESPAEIPFTSLNGIFDLGSHLGQLGMTSEATSWHLMAIQILRCFSGQGFQDSGVFARLALLSGNLSHQYQIQSRWDLAVKTSQQAIELSGLWQESSPDADHWPLLAGILITHSRNLREIGRPEDAISVAEEAVSVCREIARPLIESDAKLLFLTPQEEYKVVRLSGAYFALGAALSSVDRHLASYEAVKEGFQTHLKFPSHGCPPSGAEVDTFMDQICKAAQGTDFSMAMLASSAVLFHNLARIYRNVLSAPFLRLLHACVYFSQQHSPDFRNLRVFLEPESGSPPPVLDIFAYLNVHDFATSGELIEDAFWAYYDVSHWDTRDVFPLIENIFITHFDQAISALRRVTSKSTTDPHSDSCTLEWVVDDISDGVLELVPRSQQTVLLEILTKVVRHFCTISPASSSDTESVRWNFCWGLWMAGLLKEALPLVDEALEGLHDDGCDEDNQNHLDDVHDWIIRRAFMLCDMGRIPQAIEAVHEAKPKTPGGSPTKILRCCMIRKWILQRTGRDREALQLLRDVVSEVGQLLTQDDGDVHCYAHIVLADLATIRRHVGQLEDALTDAERAVAACRKDVDAATMKYQKHALVHSLTVLSNCLAVVGRNDEALVAVEEATFMYTSSAPHMWGSFLYSLRREELGANAFHSLSLRLAASGQMEESLLNAEKATDLYRELVLLAPRHLPTLATSLQNLASRLCSAGRLNESVSACEEAVDILRKVADTEFYFLGALAEALDQLSKCLVEKGEAQRTAAATAESAEVRRRIALLPPQATFLFSEIEKDDDDKASEGISTQEDAPPTYTASQVVGEEVTTEQTKTEVAEKTTKPAKPHLAILNTPLELKLSSTPLDLLWWLLVGILGAGLAVLWSRGR